jgi:ParB family transcriptional regulator, chromosome partitioning protein
MQKSRLGRGLAAIIPTEIRDDLYPGSSPEPRAAMNARVVPIDCIDPNPEQPRLHFYRKPMEELAESVRNHGVLTPLLVRKSGEDRYILIAGERRLRAAGLAGLEEVPVVIHEHVPTRMHLVLALVENLQREDLDPIETAMAYQKLLDEFNMTQAQVGARVGKDRATISNSIRLLRLPHFVLQELRSGRISTGHSKCLLSLSTETMQRAALEEIKTRELTVRQAEELVRSMSKSALQRTRPALPSKTVARLSKALGAVVKIEPASNGRPDQIVIQASSQDELSRILNQLLDVE